MVNGINMANLPEHPLERMKVVGAMLLEQMEQAKVQQSAAPAPAPEESTAPPSKSVRAAFTELFGRERRPAPDAVVRLESTTPASEPSRTREPRRVESAEIDPHYESPDETRFNRYMYATEDTANALAQRFGGVVGLHQYRWATSASATPGIADILQPPEFHVIDFGNTQVNAGELARFYEPGFLTDPDSRAAEYLFRAGVRNEFVDQHLPGYLRDVDTSNTTNPITGERVEFA